MVWWPNGLWVWVVGGGVSGCSDVYVVLVAGSGGVVSVPWVPPGVGVLSSL